MNTSAKFFLGIDGGGTKTSAVIVDAEGHEVARAQAPTSNPSVIGIEAASAVVLDIIHEAKSQVGAHVSIEKVWAGLSGFGRKADHEALRPLLTDTASDVRLTNDVEIVLSGLRDNIGVALISGTGSIVAGRNNAGDFVRVGGWGHVMGDEGSAYEIGRRGLQAVARQIDGRGPETSMTAPIFQDFGITEPYDLIRKVYDPCMDKAAIARLATHPLHQAYKKDAVSIEIVNQAADDLVLMVITAADRLGFTETIPLALTGGVMLHHLIIRERVLHQLAAAGRTAEPVLVLDPALSAARSLAGFWGIPS
jgi:glucosamine kinase